MENNEIQDMEHDEYYFVKCNNHSCIQYNKEKIVYVSESKMFFDSNRCNCCQKLF